MSAPYAPNWISKEIEMAAMGFFVSSNLALTALQRINLNNSGFGIRFHKSVKDKKHSPWTVPKTYDDIAAKVQSWKGDKEMAIIAENSFLPQNHGLVVIIALLYRGMFDNKFQFSKYDHREGPLSFPYDDSRAQRGGWGSWGTAGESESYQATDAFFRKGLANCGPTITDERILNMCIQRAVMPSQIEIVEMQQNPLHGAAPGGGADPAAAARAAERARRGL